MANKEEIKKHLDIDLNSFYTFYNGIDENSFLSNDMLCNNFSDLKELIIYMYDLVCNINKICFSYYMLEGNNMNAYSTNLKADFSDIIIKLEEVEDLNERRLDDLLLFRNVLNVFNKLLKSKHVNSIDLIFYRDCLWRETKEILSLNILNTFKNDDDKVNAVTQLLDKGYTSNSKKSKDYSLILRRNLTKLFN